MSGHVPIRTRPIFVYAHDPLDADGVLHPVQLLRMCLVGFAMLLAILFLLYATTNHAAAANVISLEASQSATHIRVVNGTSKTVQTQESFADIVVGNPEIADVAPLTDRSLYILGKAAGTTSAAIYDENRALVGVIEVEVTFDTSNLKRAIQKNVPGARISVSSVNGRILLSGSAPDAVTVEKAVSIARRFGDDVINSVSIGRSQQVMLEVRFLEASRTAGRELGVRWDVVGDRMQAASGLTGLPTGNVPFGTMVGNLLNGGVNADMMIDALERKGVARRLAEPNLVALSGQKASFLAGGEFPFPVAADDGQITIEFKKFGVGLDFTPTVLKDGLINLVIEPEVSQIDNTTSIKLDSIEIPSLIVRRASTNVELRDGQSFVIAGLLQASSTTSRDQLPWLGDVPVLGTLFRSSAYKRQETDLAIIVTPRLVKPVAPRNGIAYATRSDAAGQRRGFLSAWQGRSPQQGGANDQGQEWQADGHWPHHRSFQPVGGLHHEREFIAFVEPHRCTDHCSISCRRLRRQSAPPGCHDHPCRRRARRQPRHSDD